MRDVQVTDVGDVVLSQGAINGFLGGSVAPHPPAHLPTVVLHSLHTFPHAAALHHPTPIAAPPIPSRHSHRQVGAVGTLIATFVKRDQVKDRLKCPYCEGTGIIQ